MLFHSVNYNSVHTVHNRHCTQTLSRWHTHFLPFHSNTNHYSTVNLLCEELVALKNSSFHVLYITSFYTTVHFFYSIVLSLNLLFAVLSYVQYLDVDTNKRLFTVFIYYCYTVCICASSVMGVLQTPETSICQKGTLLV